MDDSKRLAELLAEKDSINPSFTHAIELLSKEIDRIQNPEAQKLKEPDFINVFANQRPKIECHLKIPIEEFPGVNFSGKILGPRGSTLKRIQEATNTGISILGKGSQRDESKEDELYASGDIKWAHLRHPLHVKIRAIGPLDQCYMRISHACTEVLQLMEVTDDMITDKEKFEQSGQTARPRRFMDGRRGRGMMGRGGYGMGRGGRGFRGRGRSGYPMGKPSQGGHKKYEQEDYSESYDDYPESSGNDGYGDYGYGYQEGYEGYGDSSASYGNDSTGYGEGYDNNGSYGYEGYGYGGGDDSSYGYGYGSGGSSRGGKVGRGSGRGAARSKPY